LVSMSAFWFALRGASPRMPALVLRDRSPLSGLCRQTPSGQRRVVGEALGTGLASPVERLIQIPSGRTVSSVLTSRRAAVVGVARRHQLVVDRVRLGGGRWQTAP